MWIKLLGLEALIEKFRDFKPKLTETLNAGMKEAAFAVERHGKLQITTGPNRAIKTGYLRASIAVASVLPYQAKVVVGAGYGIYVHEGTRYMQARPFLAEGLKDAVPEIEKIFGKRFKTLIETV
jgi:HK97 gp10 family phage protein